MKERDRRALVWGASVVVGALLLLRVIPWGVRSARAAHIELAERSALLARARDEVARQGTLQDSVAAVTGQVVALAPKILAGNTSAEAAADLAGRLNLAASRSGTKLERVDPLTDTTTDAGRLRRVSARVTLEGDIGGITRFLRSIEGGEAVLTISQLRLTAPDPASSDRVPERLRLEATVGGSFLTRAEGRTP
jgi:type II secretion system (T2SS) protein M